MCCHSADWAEQRGGVSGIALLVRALPVASLLPLEPQLCRALLVARRRLPEAAITERREEALIERT